MSPAVGQTASGGWVLPPRRGYQDEAVAAIAHGLAGGGRGTAVAACGTGKTLVGVHSAVELVAAGLVVVACPSLALVAQTLRVWSATGLLDAVAAVCSDPTVADSAVRAADLGCPVTVDAQQVVSWLRRTRQCRRRLVLVTHQSAVILGRALHAADTVADLLIVDEAHRSAGHGSKQAAAVHHDQLLPARRRLYLTATPKVITTRRGNSSEAILSMDDPATFGPRLYTYPFGDAIADGWLDDYRFVALGVTRDEVASLLRSDQAATRVELAGASLRTVLAQAALAKATVEFGLRRVLTFTATVRQSQEFAATLADTLRCLPERERPKGPLTAVHVDGRQSVSQRQQALDLLADPPQAGWTVLSNARCLSEGIDVPAVDAVVFASPKGSEIDIVQAVGRALRRNPLGTGIATILVPVLLTDNPGSTDDAYNDEWTQVCRVIRALRAHDTTLGAQLDARRSRLHAGDETAGDETVALPQPILFRLPDGYGIKDILQHLTVRVLEDATTTWWASFGQLRAFHAEHRHFRAPEGTTLANWMNTQRRFRRRGMLDAERIAALDGLGFDWEPRHRERERGLAAARAFHAAHGHLRVPDSYPCEGIHLPAWLQHQRTRNRAGTLPADLKDELTRIGMRWDRVKIVSWSDAYHLAAAFHAEHSHLRTPTGHTVNEFDLHSWLCKQRVDRRRGKLPAERISALDKIGMVWNLHQARWEDNFATATAFANREGHLQPATTHREQGLNLYMWLAHQRTLHARGSLSHEHIERLASIGFAL